MTDKLSMRELLRYGYTGALCALLAALVDGCRMKDLFETLGEVLTPLAALAAGTAVYVVFKSLVGDLFLRGLIDWSHAKFEDLLGRKETRCMARYLKNAYKVKRGMYREAYALVRDSIMPDTQREQLHIQHSESYLLYVTAFTFGPVSLLTYLGWLPGQVSPATSATLGAIAAVTLAAGLRNDIVLSRTECAALKMLRREKVEEILQGGGFV